MLSLVSRYPCPQCKFSGRPRYDFVVLDHPHGRCEVIPLDYIVRGAVLVGDTKYAGDYFVIDTLDADMFLRVKKL